MPKARRIVVLLVIFAMLAGPIMATAGARDGGRAGPDLAVVPGSYGMVPASPRVGDEVTGWVSRMGPEGAILALEEGLEAVIPLDAAADRPSDLRQGAIVKAVITVIDTLRRSITARLRSE